MDTITPRRIHQITVVQADNARRRTGLTDCPRQRAAVAVDACAACAFAAGAVRGAFLCSASVADARVAAGSVGALMTRDVLCVRSDVDGGTLAWWMAARHLHILPVVDAERRPVGVVTQTDLVRALSRGGLDGVHGEEAFERSAAPP